MTEEQWREEKKKRIKRKEEKGERRNEISWVQGEREEFTLKRRYPLKWPS